MDNEKKQNDDLNSLLDDYSNDNELRRKIEEMKKQKEQQAMPSTPVVNEEASEEVKQASNVDETKVMQMDQTIVMPTPQGMPQAKAQDESVTKTIVRPAYEADETQAFTKEEAYEDRTSEQVIEIEDDEDDVNEMEEEEENSEKNTNMNKALTYGIIALVALLIILAGFFGLKALSGSDKPKDDDKVVEEEKVEEEKEEEDEESASDVAGRIASIKKQNEAWKKEIDQIEEKLIDLKAEKKAAQASVHDLETAAKNAQDAVSVFDQGEYTTALAEYEAAEEKHKNGEIEVSEYEAIRARYRDAEIEYNRLTNEATKATNELQRVKTSIDDLENKIHDKEVKRDEIEASISSNEEELRRLEQQ